MSSHSVFTIGRSVLWASVGAWFLLQLAAVSDPTAVAHLLSRRLLYGITAGAPLLVGVAVILIAVAGVRAARTDARLARRAVVYAAVASALCLGAWWHPLSLYGFHRASPFAFVPLLTFAGTVLGGVRLLFKHRLLEAMLGYALAVAAQFPWHFLDTGWWSQPAPRLPKVAASLLGFAWAAALLALANAYRNALRLRGESPSVTT